MQAQGDHSETMCHRGTKSFRRNPDGQYKKGWKLDNKESEWGRCYYLHSSCREQGSLFSLFASQIWITLESH